MIYLLLVNIALAIGFALYQLSFRQLTFFQWNRFYLLGMVLISLLIPVGIYIDLSAYLGMQETIPTLSFQYIITNTTIGIVNTQYPVYLIDILTWLYWGGVGFGLILLLLRLWKLRIACKQKSSYSSFSFFKKVVLGAHVKDIQAISDHEKIHVDQGHSYDILLLEVVAVLNWFNPIVYIIKKELKFQHECIADDSCSIDKVSYAELLIAHALQTDVDMLRHEFSNQSFLKKRIMMLFKNKSTNTKKLFYLSTIPLVVVLLLSTLIFNTSKAKEVLEVVETGVKDVKVTINSRPSKVISARGRVQERPSAGIIPIDTTKHIVNPGNEIFENAEILAVPNGGMVKFREWIGDNYLYPQDAIDAGVVGTMAVSFIVEKDGTLSNIQHAKDLGYGTVEALAELMKRSPKWSPAIHKGKVVRTAFYLPVKLDLT